MTIHPWTFHAIRSSSFLPFCDLDLDLWPDRSQNLIDWSLDDDKSSLKISCNSVQYFWEKLVTCIHTNHSLERIPSPTPHLLPYQRIGNWKVNILALVSYESDENWAHYDKNKFLTFSWPGPWPLTWSLPKSNQLVLGWWQIIPENLMHFGPAVFEKSW